MNNARIRPFVLGAIMTDEWAASPNMGAGDERGGNKVATMKAIQTAEGKRTLISGQSIGSWHRQALYDRCGWPISHLQEVISGRDTRQFYSQCQPIQFAEDDGRGYLAAVSVKEGSKNISVTTKRTSPFMLSQFQSVAPVQTVDEFGILARGLNETVEENRGSLIFTAQIAAAAYAGMFALNCSELGVFGVGIGRDLLPLDQFDAKLPAAYSKAVLAPSPNPSKDEQDRADDVRRALKRCVNKPRDTRLALEPATRRKRAQDLITALAELEGGAMQTRRLYNVAPAVAFVAFMDGGNCLPPHIFRAVPRQPGDRALVYEVDVERIYRILCDNAERLLDMGEEEKEVDGQIVKAKRPNIFFGCLGEPTISRASEEKLVRMLEGKDDSRKLPPQAKAAVFQGARAAIRAAADAIPESWFEVPEGAELIDANTVFGEALQSSLKPKQEKPDAAASSKKGSKKNAPADGDPFDTPINGSNDGNDDDTSPGND